MKTKNTSDTNAAVLNFRDFLISSWENLRKVMGSINDPITAEELTNDFLQSNWEIFVESIICNPGSEYLEVYGDGADCNGASSRVCFPDRQATHFVECKKRDEEEVRDVVTGEVIDLDGCIFHSFVNYIDDTSEQDLPFNRVLLESKTEDTNYIIDLETVFFSKSKITD